MPRIIHKHWEEGRRGHARTTVAIRIHAEAGRAGLGGVCSYSCIGRRGVLLNRTHVLGLHDDWNLGCQKRFKEFPEKKKQIVALIRGNSG